MKRLIISVLVFSLQGFLFSFTTLAATPYNPLPADPVSPAVNTVVNSCFDMDNMYYGRCQYQYWPCGGPGQVDCGSVDCEGSVVLPACISAGGAAQKLRANGQIYQSITVSQYANYTVSGYLRAGNNGIPKIGVKLGSSSISWQSIPATAGSYTQKTITGNTGPDNLLTIYLRADIANPADSAVTDTYVDNISLTVDPNAGSCYSISSPASPVYTGQPYTVSVQMKNTGTSTWTSSSNYHLGSQDPRDNLIWGANRAYLSAEPVGPNQIGIFNFLVTAPSTPGAYNFDWQMVQDSPTGEWFGQKCTSPVTVSAPVAASPTNPSLQVNNASSTQTSFAGTTRTSGLQSTQGGSNWLNPIKITANATPGTAAITKYYVAFYDKTGGILADCSDTTTCNTRLSTIQSRLNTTRNAGFLLAYGSGIKTGDTGNNWYVWDPSVTAPDKWVNIPAGASLRICDTGVAPCAVSAGNKELYRIFAGNPAAGNPSLPNTWQVLFDQNFGSKNMYTAVYVVDNNNLSAFVSDITPTP